VDEVLDDGLGGVDIIGTDCVVDGRFAVDVLGVQVDLVLVEELDYG